MARLIWAGSPFNTQMVDDLYIEDRNGATYAITDCIKGNITFTAATVSLFNNMVNGRINAVLPGDIAPGTVAMTLDKRWIADNGNSNTPSFIEVLAQKNLGTSYEPWKTITTPVTGRIIYAHPEARTWKLVCRINSEPMDGASLKTEITAYVQVPNPTIDIAYSGGGTALAFGGAIIDQELMNWTTV
jgi:hypothetical protein